jgi:quercetin dioxygenase-like cupin family protein
MDHAASDRASLPRTTNHWRMVFQTKANDSFVRSITDRKCGVMPTGAREDGGRIKPRQHRPKSEVQSRVTALFELLEGDGDMIRAYRLYTGPDGNSHVLRGSVIESKLVDVQTILFKETPAHSSFEWHNDPIPQYVITLAGVLEFTTVGGETFTVHPGDVLLAEDHTGSGHKWRLINDEPWRRAYVVFKKGADTQFVPDRS